MSERHETGRALRVCMFVYNNCAADQRVLKEADTLLRAGHRVHIVAVLDKLTVPEETRDGIEITRIDRNPPHYRLLRRSRRVRRWFRLKGRIGWRSYLLARPAARVRRALPRATRIASQPYRAARWRVLRRSPKLARRFYARQARVRREAVARSIAAAPARSPVSPPLTPAARSSFATRHPAAGRLIATADAEVSDRAYRSVMRLHKPLLYLDFYKRAYRWARPRGFDVVHAHDLNTLPVAAALARTTDATLVYDAHELYPEVSTLSARERKVWRFAEKRLVHRADAVITVCESIAGELRTRHGIGPPVVLLNCPPETQLPQARVNGEPNPLRERAGMLGSSEPIVLYQGGFAPNRGLAELITAGRELHRGTIVLMGWGALEEELSQLIERFGLGDRVRIVERVPPAELLDYTRGADIGVIPYRPVGLNNTYTTPNKLFEYIAAGVPVAGSRLPELERFVTGLEVGVTFDAGDPADIARKLNSLLADPAALARMQENELAVRHRFVWEQQGRLLVDLYAEVSG